MTLWIIATVVAVLLVAALVYVDRRTWHRDRTRDAATNHAILPQQSDNIRNQSSGLDGLGF